MNGGNGWKERETDDRHPGQPARHLADDFAQARTPGEGLHRTCAQPTGRSDEKRHVEPVALVPVFRLEQAERAMVVGMLVDVEGQEGEDACDGGDESHQAGQRDGIAACAV